MDPEAPIISSSSNPPTTDAVILLNIPISTKLTRTNFLAWKSQIEPVLHGYGLHHFLTSTFTNPPSQSWTKQDQLILAWLRSSLSETLLGQVVSCTTSSALWTNLQQSFSATSRARLTELWRALQTTVKGRSTCTEYLNKMRAIADELSFIGSPVSDEDLVIYVLTGLGSEFNAVVAAATSSRHETLSFSELQGMLFNFESLLQS